MDGSNKLHFVIVPKIINRPFFDAARDGCKARALELENIECHYIGPKIVDAIAQATIIRELVTYPSRYNLTKIPDGISVAVIDENITGEAINYASNFVPVTTWDADAPKSKRKMFIGTDNYALGNQLGLVLNKLNPNGTNYGLITGIGPNLQMRVDGVRDRLENDYKLPTKWKEVSYSPLKSEENVTLALDQMYQYANDPNIRAIISVGGWPMVDPSPWKKFINSNKHITTVVADSSENQILLMNQGFVNGLVGQMPYQMGGSSVDQLLSINDGNYQITKQALVTPLLDVSRIPTTLPNLTLNHNYIGNLVIIGYITSALIILSSISIFLWVHFNRTNTVIRKSQPIFLQMICMGTLIMGLAILPLTADDENNHESTATVACMAFPWLLSVGFTAIFAALFSKTWRIYEIMKNAKKFRRIQVTPKDVLAPYAGLMLVNFIILMCWTIFSPLKYVRYPLPGTDDWGRVISTYGVCTDKVEDSKTELLYPIALMCINGISLITANVYAYLSRRIKTEYSESRYIAIIMSSLLQTSLIFFPVAFLMRTNPKATFIVLTLFIFIICMNVLCFLFIPKALMMRKQHGATNRESINDGLKFVMHRNSNAGKNFDASTFKASAVTSVTTASGSIKKVEDLVHVQFTSNTA